MQNGIPVGLRSSPSFGLSRSGQLTAIIQSLFWDGSQGWWYDDNDTTTLFQDSAGTTPVTAVEQFVGLQLDKSKGLVLGPQLFTDFTTEGTWTDNGNGSWSITSAVGSQDLRVDYVGTTNKRYVITVTVSGHSGSQLTIYPLNTAPYTAGNGSFTTRENSNAGFFIIRASSGASATVSNISIRELPGNHRYAPASGNRPIWSKRVNLLTKTEQFDDAAWQKGNATVTANAATAPDGTLTADALVEDTASSPHRVFRDVSVVSTTATLTRPFTYSVYLKPNTRLYAVLGIGNARFTRCIVNLSTGVAGAFSGAEAGNLSISINSVGNGWWLAVISGTYSVSDSPYVWVGPSDGTESYTGNGTSNIFAWGADFRPANQATGLLPLYQRVNTSSDYDTNGFPGYLKADGVDDFLQTNSINFTATDKITLCAGLRKLSDATVGIVNELSVDRNSNNGSWTVLSPSAGSTDYAFFSKGTIAASVSAAFIAPTTNVLAAIGEISTDTCLLRVNGTQVASSSANQGTGNYGNYPAYFFRRGGTIQPFTGNEYGNIAVGKLLTADQLTALETYMNGLTKAY